MSLMFGLGNFMWTSTTGMVEPAVNVCILDRVGGIVDAAAHKIGSSIMSSGIVAAFVAFSLIVYILPIARGAGGSRNTSQLFQKVLIVALFGLMLVGAQASTGGTGDANDYELGFGSPGWFVTTIDDIVSASANTIVSNVADKSTAIEGAEERWDGRYAGQDGVLGSAPKTSTADLSARYISAPTARAARPTDDYVRYIAAK